MICDGWCLCDVTVLAAAGGASYDTRAARQPCGQASV